MVRALRHRGPDGDGIYVRGPCALAHTRLAVIDLAGGRQPMASRDGDCLLTYNGEVFDYVELRAELEARGRTFETTSDTEVVLQAWLEWGEDAFLRFNGQFALAIWDARRERLVLARDRLGVRPLYVCQHAGRVYFASEIKAIFAADPTISRALCPLGLDETFTFWTTVAPRTAFAAVEELPPGHLRIYEHDRVTERAYWTPSYPHDFRGTIDDAAAALDEALARATRLRLTRADVTVGAYLSGGLDSSLVAAFARRASVGALETFAIRFQDDEYDEGHYQALAARALETTHHEIVVTAADIASVLPDVVRHAERPLLRTAPAPMLLLSRLVRSRGIKVVLTGEGADEMFAGYDLFREAKLRRWLTKQPSSRLRPALLRRLYPYLARSPVTNTAMARAFFANGDAAPEALDYAHLPRWRTTSALKRLFSRDLEATLAGRDARADFLASLPPDIADLPPLARDQYVETRTLLSGYLLSAQGDRMAMAASIEGRFPFLDRDVVDLAASLPPAHKLHVLDEKHVLKRVAAARLPREIVRRPKQPYRSPDALALVGPGAPAWISDVLSPDALKRAGLFDPALVERLWTKCRAAPGKLSNFDNMALVGTVSTQLLHRLFVEAPLTETSP